MCHAVLGDVARVNGQLAVSRAFGDKNLKLHLRSDPDVENADIDADTDLLILASDGLWKVLSILPNLLFIVVFFSIYLIQLTFQICYLFLFFPLIFSPNDSGLVQSRGC